MTVKPDTKRDVTRIMQHRDHLASNPEKLEGARGSNGDLFLQVVEQPSNTFYKDEGGKSNHLCSSVMISIVGENRSGVSLGKIFLKPVLVYESGKEVEDADEIFKLLSIEPPHITKSEQPMVVKFRIEKVSRRKDGKKFKLRYDVDYENSNIGNLVFNTVYTNPVVVLSKRKLSFNSTGSTVKSLPKKKGRNGKENERIDDYSNWTKMHKQMLKMEARIVDLSDRIAVLESDNKNLRVHLDETAHNPLSTDDYRPRATMKANFNDKKAMRQRNPTNKLLADSFMDIGDFPIRYEDDSWRGMKTGKSNSDLLNFDFGLPSSAFLAEP